MWNCREGSAAWLVYMRENRSGKLARWKELKDQKQELYPLKGGYIVTTVTDKTIRRKLNEYKGKCPHGRKAWQCGLCISLLKRERGEKKSQKRCIHGLLPGRCAVCLRFLETEKWDLKDDLKESEFIDLRALYELTDKNLKAGKLEEFVDRFFEDSNKLVKEEEEREDSKIKEAQEKERKRPPREIGRIILCNGCKSIFSPKDLILDWEWQCPDCKCGVLWYRRGYKEKNPWYKSAGKDDNKSEGLGWRIVFCGTQKACQFCDRKKDKAEKIRGNLRYLGFQGDEERWTFVKGNPYNFKVIRWEVNRFQQAMNPTEKAKDFVKPRELKEGQKFLSRHLETGEGNERLETIIKYYINLDGTQISGIGNFVRFGKSVRKKDQFRRPQMRGSKRALIGAYAFGPSKAPPY